MKRREFLATATEAVGSFSEEGERTEVVQDPQASPRLTVSSVGGRKLLRTTTGLEPYSGPWNTKTAAHLLRRTIFGPKRSEILSTASGSLSDTLTALFAAQPAPDPPIGPGGQTWVNSPYDSANEGLYASYLKAWWVGVMVSQGISIREKMVLSWHNHFVTEYVDVQDSRFLYRQLALFRQYALGNIKELVKAVTIDPAMLRYLNSNTNIVGRPNENYARELLELFTIGKGPELAQGNYTNYTEQDVQAAAKVLTGFSDVGYRNTQNATIGYSFNSGRHDTSNKQFSSAYGNRVILGKTGADGAKELDELADMIFAQPETAKFLCRKLYRWFVYYDIDANAEQNVIAPMADIMRANNYEVKPVLDALFRSAHFYDDNNIGCVIKNPADFIAGAIRQLGIATPSLAAMSFYRPFNELRVRAANLQMNLLDPPNVAGWAAYYQTPDFYEIWLSTATLPLRGQFTDLLFTGLAGMTLDRIAYAATMSNPSDPWKLIDDLAEDLFPIAITKNQIDYVMYNAMGLRQNGEYDWTLAWNAYNAPGGNTTANRNLVLKMLDPMLKFMFRMAEFQLS